MNKLFSEKRILSMKAAMFVEPSYICPICGQVFESRDDLSIHFDKDEWRDTVEHLVKNKGKFT